MTNSVATKHKHIGKTVHCVVPIAITFNRFESRVLERGEQFELTPIIYENSLDRDQRTWFDRLDDEHFPLQLGEWPATLTPWFVPGDSIWTAHRAARSEEAHAIQNPAERQKALAAITREFGSAATSVELAQYRGDDE